MTPTAIHKACGRESRLTAFGERRNERTAELFLGRTVRSLEPQKKQVQDDRQVSYTYEKLLLATGGTPRRLPSAERISFTSYPTGLSRLRECAGKASTWV